MKNFVQKGKTITVFNQSEDDFKPGDWIFLSEGTFGICQGDIKSGTEGSVLVSEVVRVKKNTGVEIECGEALFLDFETLGVTNLPGQDAAAVGMSTENAADDAEEVTMLLSPMVAAYVKAYRLSNIADLLQEPVINGPGSFSNVGDVQTYLNAEIPNITARLETIENNYNALLQELKSKALMVAD